MQEVFYLPQDTSRMKQNNRKNSGRETSSDQIQTREIPERRESPPPRHRLDYLTNPTYRPAAEI